MARVGLLFRISAGLVALTLSIVLALDFLGLLQQAGDQRIDDRARLAELVATQISASPSVGNLNAMRGVLQAARRNDPTLLSAGLRGANGRLLTSTPDHRELWQPSEPEQSTPDHMRVPIFQRGELWATLELRFEAIGGHPLTALLTSPLARLLAALGAVCFVSFALYMMRTLRHLDPSSVIPAHVQDSMDTMTEGVLILDKQEEVVLANAAFATWIGHSTKSALGVKPAALNWRLKDSEDRPLDFPWTQAIRGGVPVRGAALRLTGAEGRVATLAVNSSPFLDGWGRVKGAIVTLDDVTELERNKSELERAYVELEKSRDELRLQKEELEVLAKTDPLTGVANRRSFYETADAAVRAARAAQSPLCFVMCDIDHFKRINDEHGHSTGDEVIERLADALRTSIGSAQLVCRYGGEEFCALLDGYTAERARNFAEMVRRRIGGPGFARVPVTVSFGVAPFGSGTETAAQLIAQADEALYVAKRTGRNKVVLHGSPEFQVGAHEVR
jgi:diguanylate cyclase (GGDEF)-like protein/PAS domain S-box-containing protein